MALKDFDSWKSIADHAHVFGTGGLMGFIGAMAMSLTKRDGWVRSIARQVLGTIVGGFAALTAVTFVSQDPIPVILISAACGAIGEKIVRVIDEKPSQLPMIGKFFENKEGDK